MSNKKRLWQIFGPIIIAAIALCIVLFSPLNLFGGASKKNVKKASVSMASNVLKGNNLESSAYQENYVPFFGSSELSRFDAFHPSILAEKYHRNYRPFLVGAPGTQSLSHFLSLKMNEDELRGKKAVFIISPQWFVREGVNPQMFAFRYSNLQGTNWLSKAKPDTMDFYAGQRLAQLPISKSDDFYNNALHSFLKDGKLSRNQQTILNLKDNMLNSEDKFFSSVSLVDNQGKIEKGMAQLPAQYNVKNLDKLAGKIGAEQTTNNAFGVKNDFYRKRIEKHVGKLQGSQEQFNYEYSPEYSDFELVLDEFARLKMDVLFIIPPINQKWADYTGLSQKMVESSVKKINYQLKDQGFNRVLDLSQRGGEPYFMEDTIHIGWRGWLTADQKIAPFLKTREAQAVNYKIDDKFYTRKWQELSANAVNDFE